MYSILIVEDEFDIRENLQELLESEGFKVYTAADGAEGFLLAKNNLPDLILSDVRMPKMDGIQLLKKLQDDPETSMIPLVFLSAKVEMSDIREGMLSGADDYITKPFKSNDVLLAINARLKKQKNYRNLIEELRNSFIKNVPHELRTPLISILGFSELIENDIESLSSEDIKDIVHRINKSGKRLHRRIEKLIRYGFLLSQNEKELTGDCITELNNDYLSAIVTPKILDASRINDIVYDCLPAKVKADEGLFQEMILELVENSLKFSMPTSQITIIGKNLNGKYLLSIEDKGIGMELKKIEDVDLFKKLDPQHENREGLGLGLAIVKRISELTNVTVTIESEKKNYTRINLLFGILS